MSVRRALVVGGTGPTGPFLVNGLIDRGYAVTMLHRGTHEIDEIPPEVEHVHADPHFAETLAPALAGRSFDLAVVTYGRLRLVADALVGKTLRVVAVGGFASYRGYVDPTAMSPTGMAVPTREDGARVTDESEVRFSALISRTEDALMAHDAAGHFRATLFRYPQVYGPHQVSPHEWSVMRRALDRRPVLIVPEGGLTLVTRGWAGNLAHAVLLAVDKPDASAGQIYNCGDERQLTVRQWAEVIASAMGHRFEIVSAPDSIPNSGRWLAGFDTAEHRLLDIGKVQRELGYADVLPVEQALPRTVEWYLAHPLERGGALEQRLDPFDYAAEDRVVAALGRLREELADVPSVSASARPHAYAHPREPGLPVDHRRR